MLRFVFTRDRAIESRTTQLTRDSESDFGKCSKPGYGESDSSKIAFGRVRIATCRVRLDRLIGPLLHLGTPKDGRFPD